MGETLCVKFSLATIRLLLRAPGRAVIPGLHLLQRPGGGFVGVAGRAWIRNVVAIGHRGGDESEGVCADLYVGDGGLDFGHVAGDALAASRTLFVMSVFFERSGARAVGRERAVAVEANRCGRFAKLKQQ